MHDHVLHTIDAHTIASGKFAVVDTTKDVYKELPKFSKPWLTGMPYLSCTAVGTSSTLLQLKSLTSPALEGKASEDKNSACSCLLR
eukprot:4583890-Amphidinium_carterae.1